MTQSELNSVPLYSSIRIFWGATQFDGYLIKVTGSNADIYIPLSYSIVYDYPASGITLIEDYAPDYTHYSQYTIDTMPLFSTVLVSYNNIQKTGVVIDKSLNYNQLNVFYSDGSAEWINMDYISLVSTPGIAAQPVKPPDEYTPGVQPPGVVRTQIVEQETEPARQSAADTTGQESKTNVIIIGIIIIAGIALIK